MLDKLEPIAMQVNRSTNPRHGSSNYRGRRYEYYHFIGNTKENYYKLKGYPTDWKQRKKSVYNTSSNKSYGSGHSNVGHGYKYSGNGEIHPYNTQYHSSNIVMG